MFTGIIETIGTVKTIQTAEKNIHLEIASSISNELKVDQSVAHNGVCLTVTAVDGDMHWVTAIDETLRKSTLGSLKPGDQINLERCMLNNGRFDGHIVQGHVDQVAVCEQIKQEGGSWIFEFGYNPGLGNITVEKGSITVNGISLTCFNTKEGAFSVAIIPYTFENTNMKRLKVGDSVNLEFDIIGKYVQRLLSKS